MCHCEYFNPPGDILVAVNTSTGERKIAGTVNFHSSTRYPDKADAVVQCLFAANIPNGPGSATPCWTWSTVHADMKPVLEDFLRSLPLRPQLRMVGVASEQDLTVANETREACFKILSSMMVYQLPTVGKDDYTRCHGCSLKRESFFADLSICRCHCAWYHSPECATTHQPKHQQDCERWTIRGSGLSPYQYYNRVARTQNAARELLQSLGLDERRRRGPHFTMYVYFFFGVVNNTYLYLYPVADATSLACLSTG